MKTLNKRLSLLAGSAALAASAAFAFAAPAHAAVGTVILEGSDAIGYHCGFGAASACAYGDQTWSAIGGADARPIAVVGTTTSGNPVTSGTHAIVDMVDLSGAGALTDYAAIYFIGSDGCCTSDPASLAGRGADVTAYVGVGGTVEIGNYDGQAGWDFSVGGSTNSDQVAGIGGALGGPGCTDGETVNATGIANGFTQPDPVGCWTHQAYDMPYFATLGFTKSFFDADPGFAAANPGFGPFSSLLSRGSTITGGGGFGGTPEPGTWAMMVLGFGGIGALMRSRRRTAMATA